MVMKEVHLTVEIGTSLVTLKESSIDNVTTLKEREVDSTIKTNTMREKGTQAGGDSMTSVIVMRMITIEERRAAAITITVKKIESIVATTITTATDLVPTTSLIVKDSQIESAARKVDVICTLRELKSTLVKTRRRVSKEKEVGLIIDSVKEVIIQFVIEMTNVMIIVITTCMSQEIVGTIERIKTLRHSLAFMRREIIANITANTEPF